MYKTLDLVMLPTDEKAPTSHQGIVKQGNSLLYFDKSIRISKDVPREPQNLYILSDEKPKEGDWIIYNIHCSSELNDFNTINEKAIITVYNPNVHPNKRYCKKIIATTNDSLKVTEDFNEICRENILPQIPQSFIEKYIEEYNKGNIITKVDVEYEYRHDSSVSFPKTLDGKEVLKINSDGTINIKPTKNGWSREEVVELIRKCINDRGDYMTKEWLKSSNWIEKNL